MIGFDSGLRHQFLMEATDNVSLIREYRFMMTSSNGNILLALSDGNPPVTDGFPKQRPMTRSFDVFYDLRLNKRLSNETPVTWDAIALITAPW